MNTTEASFPFLETLTAKGRVVITATTDNQVNGIIWREIKRLVRGARVPIPGGEHIAIRALTGITHPETLSEIRGYTAKEAEAIAGVSGAFNEAVAGDARGFNLLGNQYWDYYYHFQKIEARIERPKDAGPIGRIKTSVLLFSREMDVAGAFAVAWDDFASALFEKPATAEPASGATQ